MNVAIKEPPKNLAEMREIYQKMSDGPEKLNFLTDMQMFVISMHVEHQPQHSDKNFPKRGGGDK